VGDLTATGLPDTSCDAVISLDVLLFVPDKAAAAREIARILRPGGRLALTTWERLAHPADDDPQRRALASTFHDHPLLQSARANYRQLIETAGLAVEAYQEPPGWRAQQQALAEGIIAAEAQVTPDMGATTRPWPGSSWLTCLASGTSSSPPAAGHTRPDNACLSGRHRPAASTALNNYTVVLQRRLDSARPN